MKYSPRIAEGKEKDFAADSKVVRVTGARQARALCAYLADPESLPTKHKTSSDSENLLRYLWRGGLPGLFDLKDRLVPDYLKSHVETYILRDILSQVRIMLKAATQVGAVRRRWFGSLIQ